MPASKTPTPCGSWPSPFTTEVVTGKSLSLGELQTDECAVYWLEGRPATGESVVVRWTEADGAADVTPKDVVVGTRVHEYGGGAYGVRHHQLVYSNVKTGGAHRVDVRSGEVSCVLQRDNLRFADFDVAVSHALCVCEDHTDEKNVRNSVVALSLSPDAAEKMTTIAEGKDFYCCPRLSPDGRHVAWVEWDHPNMPWQSTRLCVADVDAAMRVSAVRVLAGAQRRESLVEAGWAADGRLLVCSDRTDWWNLYVADVAADATVDPLRALAPMEAEIGNPAWVFGRKSWNRLQGRSGGILARRIVRAVPDTVRISMDGSVEVVDFGQPSVCPCVVSEERFAWVNCPVDEPPQVVIQDGLHGEKRRVLRRANETEIAPSYVSKPVPITYPTRDGEQAHAFFYAPANAECEPQESELPPLLLMAHGGPTGSASPAYSAMQQYWTSRGFALVDVNYRGSTGFGRPYREALNRQWGIRDVHDCADACTYLINEGKVDPKRVVIRGGSAGGFTVLMCLIQEPVFAAGACLFGVVDLRALTEETHKFESQYLTGLIGRYPEEMERYVSLSPLTHMDDLRKPLIVFQGLDDKVVPPAQAETIVAALKKNHMPYAYYTFEGEGHGFRKQASNATVLEMEISFYGKALGFTPTDLCREVEIHKD